MTVRTDMAIEAKRLWDNSPDEKTKLSGVVARQSGHFGIPIDIVEIISEEGAKQLGKPVGTYVTVGLDVYFQRTKNSFLDTVGALARVLKDMLDAANNVLVVGLGNTDITADSVGPRSLDYLIVTRHLQMGETPILQGFSDVSAVAPGVLGKTGIESAELVRGVLEEVHPEAVVVVDALASCEPHRLCMSVQITDTGIVPGSGVGNHRTAFTAESLGCPVIAIGVPTVVHGKTFLSLHGYEDGDLRNDLILSPRDIDLRVCDLGKLIGYAINLAVQPQLTAEDIPLLLS